MITHAGEPSLGDRCTALLLFLSRESGTPFPGRGWDSLLDVKSISAAIEWQNLSFGTLLGSRQGESHTRACLAAWHRLQSIRPRLWPPWHPWSRDNAHRARRRAYRGEHPRGWDLRRRRRDERLRRYEWVR